MAAISISRTSARSAEATSIERVKLSTMIRPNSTSMVRSRGSRTGRRTSAVDMGIELPARSTYRSGA